MIEIMSKDFKERVEALFSIYDKRGRTTKVTIFYKFYHYEDEPGRQQVDGKLTVRLWSSCDLDDGCEVSTPIRSNVLYDCGKKIEKIIVLTKKSDAFIDYVMKNHDIHAERNIYSCTGMLQFKYKQESPNAPELMLSRVRVWNQDYTKNCDHVELVNERNEIIKTIK